MIGKVFRVGLLAGLLAGLAIAVLQQFTTVPLILAAERYEESGKAASWLAPGPVLLAHNHEVGKTASDAKSASDGGAGAHEHGDGWKPADGIERTLSTSVATVATTIGYALILIAGMLAAGDRITVRMALGWGAGAFAATALATGIGLAPELPGSAAGELVARQAWWIGTAAATAIGLWALFRLESPAWKAGAVLLILAPHVIGAPRPARFESTVPAELAAHFTATSIVLAALTWMLVAAAVGYFWDRPTFWDRKSRTA
jgi:cobalt transporter subunit CbtA